MLTSVKADGQWSPLVIGVLGGAEERVKAMECDGGWNVAQQKRKRRGHADGLSLIGWMFPPGS